MWWYNTSCAPAFLQDDNAACIVNKLDFFYAQNIVIVEDLGFDPLINRMDVTGASLGKDVLDL